MLACVVCVKLSTLPQGNTRIRSFCFTQNAMTVSITSFGNFISPFLEVYCRLWRVRHHQHHFFFAEISIPGHVLINKHIHPHPTGLVAPVDVVEVMGVR